MPATRYTMSHWGTYEIHQGRRGPRLKGLEADPDPSPIGLHMLAPEIAASRVWRPAIRQSWLEQGPGARPDLRGRDAEVRHFDTLGRSPNDLLTGGEYDLPSRG